MGVFAMAYYDFMRHIVMENDEDRFVEMRYFLPSIKVRYCLTNCLSAFDHFVGLALKGLKYERVLLIVAGMEICEFLPASFFLQVTQCSMFLQKSCFMYCKYHILPKYHIPKF